MGRNGRGAKGVPERRTADLSAYPDLVVIHLGMRANSLRGLKTLMVFGPKIDKALSRKPDGLLLHEYMLFSMLHIAFRQYWRDFESLEDWARSGEHAQWWQGFLKDPGGTGFWHETYGRGGLIESVYIDMKPVGLAKFATMEPARGPMFSSRSRLGLKGDASTEPVISEDELYGS